MAENIQNFNRAREQLPQSISTVFINEAGREVFSLRLNFYDNTWQGKWVDHKFDNREISCLPQVTIGDIKNYIKTHYCEAGNFLKRVVFPSPHIELM